MFFSFSPLFFLYLLEFFILWLLLVKDSFFNNFHSLSFSIFLPPSTPFVFHHSHHPSFHILSSVKDTSFEKRRKTIRVIQITGPVLCVSLSFLFTKMWESSFPSCLSGLHSTGQQQVETKYKCLKKIVRMAICLTILVTCAFTNWSLNLRTLCICVCQKRFHHRNVNIIISRIIIVYGFQEESYDSSDFITMTTAKLKGTRHVFIWYCKKRASQCRKILSCKVSKLYILDHVLNNWICMYEVNEMHISTKWFNSSNLAKSRSASLDMVMLVRFCWRTKMFLHIFLIPDSLILLKYWAPLIRIQEIRWPRPGGREQKVTINHEASKQRGWISWKSIESREEQQQHWTQLCGSTWEKLNSTLKRYIRQKRNMLYTPPFPADLQRCTETCAAAELLPWPPLWLRCPCSVLPPAGHSPCSPHLPQWHNSLALSEGSGKRNNAP